MAGQVALSGRMLVVPNLETYDFSPRFMPRTWQQEGFKAYVGIAIQARGLTNGMLELYQRDTLNPSGDWLTFLEMLAGQAAIAIDNGSLYNDLLQAYDSTLDIPTSHHECWDGSGYPLGLRGEAIPLAARIFAVVDVWTALLEERPYRPAWPIHEVKEYLRRLSEIQFDPQVVEEFLSMV